MKNWLKGGLIGAVVWIALFLIWSIGFFLHPWLAGPSASEYFHDSLLVFFIWLIIFFIIGTIIGWIVNKIKSKKNKNGKR